MQMFIPAVLEALETLWNVFSIFGGRRKPPPPQRPSSDLYSSSDSPYEAVPSHGRSYQANYQTTPQHPAYQTPSEQWHYQPSYRRQTTLVSRDVAPVPKPVSYTPQVCSSILQSCLLTS